MSYYAQMVEISFNYPASSVNRAAGGFTKDDDEVIGRWVELGTDGSVVLVNDDSKPIGVITTLGPTKVGVALGPFVKGKQSGTTAIPVNSYITGATKTIRAGVTERGFCKAETGSAAANLARRVGAVIDSAATTANTEGVASTQVLMWR